MKINKLELRNIRKIDNIDLILENKNLIIGDNAKGKTTIAEVLYYCCFFKSFRTKNIYEIISFNKESASIKIEFKDDEEKQNKIEVNFYKKEKKIFLNKKEIKNLLDIICILNIIVISPDNIELINDGPSVRRKYLDMIITQLDEIYLKKLIKYRKLIKIKNNYLKQKKIDHIYLEILNEEISILNKYILDKRKKILKELETEANNIIEEVSEQKETLSIEYEEAKKISDENSIYEEEIEKRQTLRGIHLDDYMFSLNFKKAKIYASQGQKRLITLSFLLAQNKIIKNKKQKNPLVILDDVHLDLDHKRQEKLINMIEKENQTIYITTDVNNMSFLKKENYNIINML